MPQTAGDILTHDRAKTQPGYILFSPYAGDGFWLIDRDGVVVHHWPTGRFTKIAELLPDGRLLYARMRDGVFEADWDNRLLWEYRCRQHHDFCRTSRDTTIVLCNEFVINTRLWRGVIDKSDVFIEVDRAGRVVWEFHFEQALDDLVELAAIPLPAGQEDWAHTNTVEQLPDTPLGRLDPRFRAGNVLFSSRNLHTIGVIDYDTRRVVWAFGHGELHGQHMPTMLPSGNILLFDNGTARKFSRVVEIDPAAGRIVWEYRIPPRAFAPALSGQEVLPNGNLLVCCGNPGSVGAAEARQGEVRGVLLEVTREGEIVWEFHNRIDGLRDNYLNAVYRAAFCPADRVAPRLAR